MGSIPSQAALSSCLLCRTAVVRLCCSCTGGCNEAGCRAGPWSITCLPSRVLNSYHQQAVPIQEPAKRTFVPQPRFAALVPAACYEDILQQGHSRDPVCVTFIAV